MEYKASMRSSLRRGLEHLLLTVVLVSVAIGICHAQAGAIDVRGVWAQGNTILVFANVEPCNDSYPPPGVAVLMVSTDAGHTWKEGGISLAGYEFEFLYEKDGKVWIAGEHTREGPRTDPFVFVPVAGNKWEFHRIDNSNETIDGMAWGSNGELTAWITEIRLEDLERGRTYVHQSLDGGRSWKELGLARKHDVAVQNKFIKISRHMQPLWRVVEMKTGSGSLLQHRDSETSPWKTVSRFTRWRCPKMKF